MIHTLEGVFRPMMVVRACILQVHFRLSPRSLESLFLMRKKGLGDKGTSYIFLFGFPDEEYFELIAYFLFTDEKGNSKL